MRTQPSRAIARLVGFAAPALSGDFPVPIVESSRADRATARRLSFWMCQVPPAGIDGAIAADGERGCAGERTVRMIDRNREVRALIQRRRRALRQRAVVLRAESRRRACSFVTEILMRKHHQPGALGFGNQSVQRAVSHRRTFGRQCCRPGTPDRSSARHPRRSARDSRGTNAGQSRRASSDSRSRAVRDPSWQAWCS